MPDTPEEAKGIMLVEREALVRGIPSLLDGLNEAQRGELLSVGQKHEFKAERLLFCQGEPHHGICRIESGPIRSYYAAWSRFSTLCHSRPAATRQWRLRTDRSFFPTDATQARSQAWLHERTLLDIQSPLVA